MFCGAQLNQVGVEWHQNMSPLERFLKLTDKESKLITRITASRKTSVDVFTHFTYSYILVESKC